MVAEDYISWPNRSVQHVLIMRKEEETARKFLTAFLNAHRSFEEYEILLKIIFTLVEHHEIDIEEVVDNVAETENKEALVIILQKAEELKVRRSMNTARWEL